MKIPAPSLTINIPKNYFAISLKTESESKEKDDVVTLRDIATLEFNIVRCIVAGGLIFAATKAWPSLSALMERNSYANWAGNIVGCLVGVYAIADLAFGTFTVTTTQKGSVTEKKFTPVYYSQKTGFKLFHTEIVNRTQPPAEVATDQAH
jgi:hypothetical protein